MAIQFLTKPCPKCHETSHLSHEGWPKAPSAPEPEPARKSHRPARLL
jgi:hypothetical protein